jgi:hypothetical protein
MLLSGNIRVIKAAPNGRELQLYRVMPGESCILTSSCLLGNTRYHARGITEQPLEMVLLPATAFHDLLGKPDLRYGNLEPWIEARQLQHNGDENPGEHQRASCAQDSAHRDFAPDQHGADPARDHCSQREHQQFAPRDCGYRGRNIVPNILDRHFPYIGRCLHTVHEQAAQGPPSA